MVKKEYQSPTGGLNKKGREFFKRKEGANLNQTLKELACNGVQSEVNVRMELT